MNQLRSQFPQKWQENVKAYTDNIIKNLEDGKGKSEKSENKEKAPTFMKELRSNSAEVVHKSEASTNKYTKIPEEKQG